MNNKINIVITGGKTGGHLFPGIAIAQALERLVKKTTMDADSKLLANILFVGTNAKFETNTLKKYNYAHKAIFSKPIQGGTIFYKAFAALVILISLIQSMIILKNFKPDFVLGVGGFSSFAVILTAWLFGIPNAIQEQNAFPGMTNRVLSRFTKTIFTSFKNTKRFKNNPKTNYVGNPVRASVNIEDKVKHYPKSDDPDKFTILVTGGSQGAASINKAFIDALELMENKNQFNIFHQTGVNDEVTIQKKYESLNIDATAKAFFHDMPMLQTKADLVITRAGAGIISELAIKGVPAILIPFPHAADDHQTFNAKTLEEQGAAIMIQDKNLTGQTLKQTLEDLLKNSEKLKNIGKSLKQIAMPDAGKKISAHILNELDIAVPDICNSRKNSGTHGQKGCISFDS